MKNKRAVTVSGVMLVLGTASVGCGDDVESGGSLTVLAEAEAVIVEGIEAGDDLENIQDGWAVGFNKYIATLGHVRLRLATDESVRADAEESYVVDMTQVPESGLPLFEIENLAGGRYEFFFETPGAAHGARRHQSVSTADFGAMVDNDWTYLISGVLMQEGGQSCPPAVLATPGSATPNGNTSGDNDCYDAEMVRFEFGAQAETVFGPCQIDGVPGVAISGGAARVSATLHGDHIFFNGFPEGSESTVTRLAQWLADCDLDLDGTVTAEELDAIAPSQLPEIDDRFQLGASPLSPLETMYEYVQSQLKTQGHYQGEGECPFDGMEHDHDHDH